ncbi:helix-turn-helix domain-containing protein [Rhodococcus sp. GA1]
MSVRSLAGHAGVSPSFLSQFERGQCDASVGTLRRICASLGVTPADVLAGIASTGYHLARVHEQPQIHAAGGTRKFVLSRTPSLDVEMYRGEVDPGSCTSEEPYVHGDSTEVLHVVRGEVTYELGGRSIVMTTGDSIEHRSSEPHRLINTGDVVAEIIWVVAPPV